MSWTTADQARLDHLRERELTGTLDDGAQAELAALMARVEAEEASALAPEMAHLRAGVTELDQKLSALREESQELARLLAQQQSLAADARRFLVEFDERRSSISEALARFTGVVVPAT